MPFSCAASSASAICRAMSIASASGQAGPRRRRSEYVVERVAVHELHHERQRAALLLDAEERGDVRMVQRGEDPRLALEPCDALGIGGERRGQRLQRDVAAQLRVVRAVDFAHSAGARGLRTS